VISNSPNIYFLDLRECPKVTAKAFAAIGDFCYKLRFLEARSLIEVDDESVENICKGCTDL
jgi:hypothetical protein